MRTDADISWVRYPDDPEERRGLQALATAVAGDKDFLKSLWKQAQESVLYYLQRGIARKDILISTSLLKENTWGKTGRTKNRKQAAKGLKYDAKWNAFGQAGASSAHGPPLMPNFPRFSTWVWKTAMVDYARSLNAPPFVHTLTGLVLLPLGQDPERAYDGIPFHEGGGHEKFDELVANVRWQVQEARVFERNLGTQQSIRKFHEANKKHAKVNWLQWDDSHLKYDALGTAYFVPDLQPEATSSSHA